MNKFLSKNTNWLGIIVLVVILGTSLWLTKTASITNNIDNWKTYRNEKYGFEIKYPNDGQLITDKSKAKIGFIYEPWSCEDTAITCFAYGPRMFPETNFNGAALSVNIARDDSATTIETHQGCLDYKKDFGIPGIEKLINGVTFRVVADGEGATGHSGSLSHYIIFTNDQCFDIRIVSEKVRTDTDVGPSEMTLEMEQSTVGILNQILSTFKFIN